MKIRRVRASELERVLAIEIASFPSNPYPIELFRALARDCGQWFFAAWEGSVMAGYIVTCADPKRPRAEIISLAVDPGYRKQGVATALVKRACANAKRAGVERLSLTVRATNRGAIRLYELLGFRYVRRLAGYYENGRDGLRMVRDFRR